MILCLKNKILPMRFSMVLLVLNTPFFLFLCPLCLSVIYVHIFDLCLFVSLYCSMVLSLLIRLVIFLSLSLSCYIYPYHNVLHSISIYWYLCASPQWFILNSNFFSLVSRLRFPPECERYAPGDRWNGDMVFTLDGSSKNVAHALREIDLSGEKNLFATVLKLIKCLQQIK